MHNVDGSSMLTDKVDIFKQYVDFVKKKKLIKKIKIQIVINNPFFLQQGLDLGFITKHIRPLNKAQL